MTEEKSKTENELAEKLDKLIESKKEETKALKKIFESFDNSEKNKSTNQDQKNNIMKKLFAIISIFTILSGSLMSQGWNYVNSTGTTFILYGMTFPPSQSNIGYACGMQYTYDADGVIIKTTDGGDNWVEILPTSGTIDGLQGIWFISETIGFAAGWNDYFIKTTDGGGTWTPINTGAGAWYYKDVEFWDANNGVAVASMNSSGDQSVFITSDGGNTWNPCTSGMDNASIMGLSYADQNTIFAVGTDTKVYKSTNGGDTWTVEYTLPAMLFGVDFADASFGVVGGEEKMFATSDGGSTWTTYTTGYENFYGALAYSDGTGYIGGTDENIYVTTDFGVTWGMEHNGGGSSSLYRIKDTENGNLFACGSQGQIINRAPIFGSNFSSSTDSICVGNSIDFTDMSIGGPTTWNWTFEGGTPSTSTAQNPTIQYDTPGVFDVTLVVSDGVNTDTKLVTDMITVIADLGAPIEPTGITEMCAGNTETYTTQPLPDAVTYIWEVDPTTAGTITGTGTSGLFDSDDTYTGGYTIKVRANNLCGYGPWSSSLNCTLNMNPIAFVLSDGGGYCSGDPGIEITLDGSETGVDYELLLESASTGIILAGTGNPISFGLHTDQGIYTVTGTTGTCTENMIGTPYIFVEFTPEPGYTPAGPDVACAGSISDYTTQSIFGSDTLYWNLTPVDAGTIIGSGENISIEWAVDYSGIASLTTNGSNDCGVGNESTPLEITISESPAPQVTGLELVCDEVEAEYTTTDNTGSTYEWTVTGGEIISGSGTYLITVLWGEAGLGTVQVIESIGSDCSGTSEILEVTIDDCTSIDEIFTSELTVYPNPVSDVLKVNFVIIVNESYTISAQNLLGQDIKIIKGIGTGMQETHHIDTRDMKEGQYFISVRTEKGAYLNKKFIVIK